MATQVFVQMDGVVNHRHDGVKGWHDPAAKHKDGDLHDREDVAHPTNLKDLSADHKKQYRAALGGTSFYKIWLEAKNARVAAGKVVRGPGKPKAQEPSLEAEFAAVLATLDLPAEA